jgi:hypothetical protein
MITVFPLALVTETQSALLTAFGIGSQAAIAFIFVTNISDAKPAIHPTRRYIRYLGTCCHLIYLHNGSADQRRLLVRGREAPENRRLVTCAAGSR